MAEKLGLKDAVTDKLQSVTVDKLVGTERMSDDDFILGLFDIVDDEKVTEQVKEKISSVKLAEELDRKKAELDEQEEIKELYKDEFTKAEKKHKLSLKKEIPTEAKDIVPVQKAEIVEAEQVSPEMIRFIKNELMEELKTNGGLVINKYNNGRAVAQEEFYKIQLWSYFPLIGIPVYFLFLVALSANIRGKYTVTMQNFAKAQLRTFWAYLIAHLSVLFVAYYSIISFMAVIRRGLTGI